MNRQAKQRISPIALITLIAFGQSLVFLVFWLFFCASAGAANTTSAELDPQLRLSTYAPAKARNPFLKPNAATAGLKSTINAASLEFHLQGILYHPTSPSAMVNDQLVSLDKTVDVKAGGSDVRVRALEITRDRVLLEANGQKVELRLNNQEPIPAPPR
jgi:hypothetical protein